uniref:BPTI/Kunitz inhibitor domain-containing protein n=1 Tax=Neogobius melanostomus TaxID=47308 RepID=A0A8C6TER3_9GOBI
MCFLSTTKPLCSSVYPLLFPSFLVARSICSLPRAAGSCSSWTPRYHFDVLSNKCVHFWFGSCHGNSNNFMTRDECQRACPTPAPSQQDPKCLRSTGLNQKDKGHFPCCAALLPL